MRTLIVTICALGAGTGCLSAELNGDVGRDDPISGAVDAAAPDALQKLEPVPCPEGSSSCFRFDWTLYDAQTADVVDCTDVDGYSVEISATLEGEDFGFGRKYPCDEVPEIPQILDLPDGVGLYTIQADFMSNNGSYLAKVRDLKVELQESSDATRVHLELWTGMTLEICSVHHGKQNACDSAPQPCEYHSCGECWPAGAMGPGICKQ
jgi:hypothetical protein